MLGLFYFTYFCKKNFDFRDRHLLDFFQKAI